MPHEIHEPDPLDHLVASFAREHKLSTRLGHWDVECGTCHDQDFCTDCHGASATVLFGKGARMSDPSPGHR